jgi:hypothetical protein
LEQLQRHAGWSGSNICGRFNDDFCVGFIDVFGCGFDIYVQEPKVTDENGFGYGVVVFAGFGYLVAALLFVEAISP